MRIAVGPTRPDWVMDAVRAGGGTPSDLTADAEGLIWLNTKDMAALRDALDRVPRARWVQLRPIGVEQFLTAGLIDGARQWTCAKGSLRARPVAEHALALALAGLRLLPERIRATSWGEEAGVTLHGKDVTIVGAGGIGSELLELLAPFRVRVTVVRRSAEPAPGALRTVPVDRLDEAIDGALVVFLVLPLTAGSRQIFGEKQIALLGTDSWLVNVARGPLVDTGALVDALKRRAIGGAALDVTDPEPLPDGHPLWTLPNCIITPHTADNAELTQPALEQRISENVGRFIAGQPLKGVIDPRAGY